MIFAGGIQNPERFGDLGTLFAGALRGSAVLRGIDQLLAEEEASV